MPEHYFCVDEGFYFERSQLNEHKGHKYTDAKKVSMDDALALLHASKIRKRLGA